MELLNAIFTALTTENEYLTRLLISPLALIEGFVSLNLFITILNIESTKKQKIIYILIYSLVATFTNFLILKPYNNVIFTALLPLMIIFIFKVSFIKSLIAEFIQLFTIGIAEIIIASIIIIAFDISYNSCTSIPLCRLIISCFVYFIIYLISLSFRRFPFNLSMIDVLSKTNKRLILLNFIFAIIVILSQFILIVYYTDKLPFYIVIINIFSLVSYFAISIHCLIRTMKLEKTIIDLEEEQNYNKTLQILHDNIRAFKHDFANIIAGIGGYVGTNDMAGLEKYYKQLLEEFSQVNNLSSLNPNTINNPAVYTVLANKYYLSDEKGIKITLESFINFNELNMKIYEFTRILGILMDNAIEASSECDNKIINVTIRNDMQQNRQLLIIENTYKNKEINLDKIYEKGFSTKPKNTGLGLWEVNKIISKNKNIARFTSKNENFFVQQIEIYNE